MTDPTEPAGYDQDLTTGLPALSTSLSTSNFDPTEYFKSYIETVKLVCLSPQVFFEKMPVSGGYMEPCLFLGTGLLVNGFMMALLSFKIEAFFTTITLSLVASFVGAALAFFLSKSSGGKPPSYESIFRVYAYTGAVALVSWVPFIGALFSMYAWVLQFFGLREVGKMNTIQTLAVCVISGIFTMIIAGIAFIIMSIKAALHI